MSDGQLVGTIVVTSTRRPSKGDYVVTVAFDAYRASTTSSNRRRSFAICLLKIAWQIWTGRVCPVKKEAFNG